MLLKSQPSVLSTALTMAVELEMQDYEKAPMKKSLLELVKLLGQLEYLIISPKERMMDFVLMGVAVWLAVVL